jgi:hypothetical protein
MQLTAFEEKSFNVRTLNYAWSLTVTKAKSNAGPKHVGDEKFHCADRSEKSVIHIDLAARSTWTTEFSLSH